MALFKNNSNMSSDREEQFAKLNAAEEQRARFRAEEEKKIAEERRVQDKKMNQTEAMIAAIKAQVEKEKAAKEEAARQAELKAASSTKSSSNSDSKPKFRTISPEEMAKLEERKKMKNAGINPDAVEKETDEKPETSHLAEPVGSIGGISGGISGGPSLSNLSGGGPTLTNPNAGQNTLNSTGSLGGGLGVDITAMEKAESKAESKAEERTISLDTKAVNAAVEQTDKSSSDDMKIPKVENIKKPSEPVQKPHIPTQIVGDSSTIVVDDGSGWDEEKTEEGVSWVETDKHAQPVTAPVKEEAKAEEEVINVIPVRQRPVDANDVHSAYNIDFDDDDDDDIMAFTSNSDHNAEEEARRKAEEEAKRKAEEEARRKAEEEARQKAEEEARRKAEEEARQKAEEEARRKAEEEARQKAEEEARRKAEEEARRKAEEEARRKAEEEAKRKAEEEARQKAEEEARRKAEEEAKRKAEEEARRKAEEEAKRKAEEEARRKAEEEAKRKAEEEARRKAEEEAKRKAEEEARRKAEEEAKRKAEEEARRKAEEEAKRKAEAEARQRAEEEARRKAEEEARRKAEEEARRKAEEEARQRAEAEARQKAEEEARRKAEEEAKQKAAASSDFVLPVGAEQFLGKYLTVNSINEQIARTIRYINDNPSEPRNIVILGQYGFGTTTIAEDFARSFYALGICKTKTIAKIKAAALNRANISDAIGKLQGGCLVIENAGVITNEKLDEIYQIVSNPNNDVVVIMTGQIETLSKLFKDNAVISTQFKHLVQVHRISDMDVFAIAKEHARMSGYPCEAGAENGLRRRMQEVESGNLDRVLKSVDNAISKAHNREMNLGDQDHRLIAADFE